MTKYGYPLLARIIYRHLNIIFTPLLLAYAIIALGGVFHDSKYWLPLIVTVLFLLFFIRYYFRMYKYFPFEIVVDEEKMICTNFMNKRKKVEIKFSEIKKIDGGVFSGNAALPLYITDGKNVIGVTPHLINYNAFVTTMLSKIDRELYSQLLQHIQKLGEVAQSKKLKRNKKARKKRA